MHVLRSYVWKDVKCGNEMKCKGKESRGEWTDGGDFLAFLVHSSCVLL